MVGWTFSIMAKCSIHNYTILMQLTAGKFIKMNDKTTQLCCAQTMYAYNNFKIELFK